MTFGSPSPYQSEYARPQNPTRKHLEGTHKIKSWNHKKNNIYRKQTYRGISRGSRVDEDARKWDKTTDSEKTITHETEVIGQANSYWSSRGA
jgi:hypothetical protein